MLAASNCSSPEQTVTWTNIARVLEENIRGYIVKEVKMRLLSSQSDVHTIIGSLVAIEQVERTLMNILSASGFFKEHNEELTDAYLRIIRESLNWIENGDNTQKEQGALIVKSCVEAICKMIEKLLEAKCTSVLVALYGQQEGMLELLGKILMVPMVTEPRILFEPNPRSNVQVLFNEAKGVVLEVLKSLINHLYLKYPPQTKLQPLHFHSRLESILPELNQSIYNFRQSCSTPSEKLESSVEKFVTPAMNVMAKSIEIQDFYHIYAAIFKTMIVEVFLPEIIVSEQEKLSFLEDEVEFVNLAFDTCFNQKSKVSKVLAMKSIENLCDKIDGAISFVAIGVLGLADAILGGKSEADILRELPSIELFIKSQFVKNHTPDEVLDVCLLVITSISYHIAKRADLLYSLVTIGMP